MTWLFPLFLLLSQAEIAQRPSLFGIFSSQNVVSNVPFITSNLSSPRNNYGGYVGYQFTVGSSSLTVVSLGRMMLSGNSGTHTIKLVLDSNHTDVSGGSVSITMSGTVGQFQYVSLASPVTLSASTTYDLMCLETNGGDTWNDYGTLSHTSAATIYGPTYVDGGGTYNPSLVTDNGYGPYNFLYH